MTEMDVRFILHTMLYVQLSTLHNENGMFAVQAELV